MEQHTLPDPAATTAATDGRHSDTPPTDRRTSDPADRSPSPSQLERGNNGTTPNPTAAAAAAARQNTHRKPTVKHVAGHSRLGTRTMSSGRNLNKTINLGAAMALRDDGGPQTAAARMAHTSVPPVSPRHRQQAKRSSTSSVHLTKSVSGSNLNRNASGTHIAKTSARPSSRHQHSTSQASRPDFSRSQSHPNKLKHADTSADGPAASNARLPTAVHFEIGDDDDEETGEMEGVDDGWTDSASPCTTRDNTRSNTRSNSMNSDVRDFKLLREDMPNDKLSALTSAVGASITAPRAPTSHPGSSAASPQKAPAPAPAPASEHDAMAAAPQPLSADAIARRLLQRGQRPFPAPKVSEISALANGAPPQLEDTYASIPTGSSGGSGSGPRISRFISEESGGSSGGPRIPNTDMDPSTPSARLPVSQTPPEDGDELNVEKRDRSTPHLHAQFSPLPQIPSAVSSGPGSGHHTPSVASMAASRPSRTQQKLWLQRGLSHIEATTQEQAMALGNFQAGGVVALLKQLDKVEKEYKVMRRFHDPIQESVERLRRHSTRPGSLAELHTKDGTSVVNGSSKPATGASTPHNRNPRLISGYRTPAADSARSLSGSGNLSNSAGSGRNSFSGRMTAQGMNLTPRIDENDVGGDATDGQVYNLPPPDWFGMSLEDLETATLDIRRRMWELAQPADEET